MQSTISVTDLQRYRLLLVYGSIQAVVLFPRALRWRVAMQAVNRLVRRLYPDVKCNQPCPRWHIESIEYDIDSQTGGYVLSVRAWNSATHPLPRFCYDAGEFVHLPRRRRHGTEH